MNTDTQEGRTVTLLAPMQQTNMLSLLLLNTKFTDVSLFGAMPSTGQQQAGITLQPVRAHKSLLAAGSKFFDELFSSEFADSRKDEFTLKNMSHDILKLVVEALYTGKVSEMRIVTEVEVACDMLESFKYLLMDELASACENILIKHHLTVAKCIHVWKITSKYTDLPELTMEVKMFMAMSLAQLSLEQSFLSLTSDEICRMVLLEPIEVLTSADVRFRAVFAWLNYNPLARRAFSDDILSLIPFTPGKISRESLTMAADSNALTETAMKKILGLLASSLNVAGIDFLVEPDFIAQKTSPTTNGGNLRPTKVSAIFCVGGISVGHENDCLKYDVISMTWQHLKKLPWKRYGGGSCVVGDRLMLFGGYVNGERSSSVIEYNLSSEDSSWETAESTWQLKRCLACSVGDIAYVSGGNQTFFAYAPSTRVWKEKTRVITGSRVGSSIVYSQTSDAVYVAGGTNCDDNLSARGTQIAKFDVKNNYWETVGFAKNEREWLGTAACGDNLYLISGDFDWKSVEAFNIRTGKAYAVPDLLYERQSCQAALLYNNVICVFGGNEKSVESFDVREGKWTTGVVVPDMPFANSVYSSLAWK